jgi:hypothetical protein
VLVDADESSSMARSNHPAARSTMPRSTDRGPSRTDDGEGERATAPTLLPGVLLDTDELCVAAGVTVSELCSLVEYGVVRHHRTADDLYDDEALEIASIARHLLRAGIDARHLRGWRVAAEREAGLFDQLIQPLIRQRNPASRSQAQQTLTELEQAGGRLRAAMMRSSLRQFTEL